MGEPIRDKRGLQAFYDDPETVRTYLTRISRPIGSVLHERQVEFLNRTIADLAPARMLELAPGPARLSSELRQVPVAVAMDFSPRMLAEAQRRTEEAGFAVRRLEGIMRRFRWQWQVQRLHRLRLGALARFVIRALEWGPDDNPSTWMVLCKAKERG